jgi:hypothetical protein
MGRLATRGFRQRLKDRYHAPETQSDLAIYSVDDPSSGIRMNRFLLDYVLDMGPASITDSNVLKDATDPSYPEVELSDIRRRPNHTRHSGSGFP